MPLSTTPSVTRPRQARLAALHQLGIQIEAHKARLTKDRDALRELLADAEAVAESADDAIEELNTAKRAVSDAVDALSRYL